MSHFHALPHAVKCFLFWLLIGAAYDIALDRGFIPHPPLTDWLRDCDQSRPLLFGVVFWSIAALLYMHVKRYV